MPPQILLFRKGGTIGERAGTALASLQRSTSAIGILRERIESRIGSGSEDPGLARVLELVKNAELLLKEMSYKAESVRYLGEFITIMNSAKESVGGIEGDIVELVPRAEEALSEMSDVISSVLLSMSAEVDPLILAKAAAQVAALGTGKADEKSQLKEPEAQKESEEELEKIAI
jgi:hypothetical protein